MARGPRQAAHHSTSEHVLGDARQVLTTRIGPREALALMQGEGWLYVDVRSVPEFDRGHPSGAYNVPLLDLQPSLGGLVPNPDFLAVMRQRFGEEARLIVGCQMGSRSLHAAQILLDAGFRHVVDQKAGWDGAKDRLGRLTEPGWARLDPALERVAGQPMPPKPAPAT